MDGEAPVESECLDAAGDGRDVAAVVVALPGGEARQRAEGGGGVHGGHSALMG